MNRMSPCFNIFSLPCSLFCDCAGCVPSRLFCVCVREIFMHCSGDVLWGCSSGESQPASFSLPHLFSFSPLCLALSHIFFSVAHHCSSRLPSSFPLSSPLAVPPSPCYTVEEQHHCALHPLFRRPTIFQDCYNNRLLRFSLTVHIQPNASKHTLSLHVAFKDRLQTRLKTYK